MAVSCVLGCRNVCGKQEFFSYFVTPSVKKPWSLTRVSRQHNNSYDGYGWNFLSDLKASARFSSLCFPGCAVEGWRRLLFHCCPGGHEGQHVCIHCIQGSKVVWIFQNSSYFLTLCKHRKRREGTGLCPIPVGEQCCRGGIAAFPVAGGSNWGFNMMSSTDENMDIYVTVT